MSEEKYWKLNFDQKVNHLVNPHYDQYLGHQVKGMQANFKYAGDKQIKDYDQDMLNHKFFVAVQRVVDTQSQKNSVFTVADCFNASFQFMDQLKLIAPNRIKHCKVKYTSSEQGQDYCDINFELTPRTHFLNEVQNPFYQRPNEVHVSYSFFKYWQRLADLGLHSTTLGWAHRYHKTAYQKYIQQTFKPFQVGGLSLHPEYKLSWNTRFIETNCNEVMQKQSLMLKYYFNSDSQLIKRLLRVAMWQENDEVINRQSDLFKGFFFNPENFGYFKASSKQRKNKVGNRHSSTLLLERACGEDSVKSFKLGLRLGQVSTQMVGSHIAANLSTELVKGQDINLLKSKFFVRKTVPFADAEYDLQTTLAGGYIYNLNENALRVNDAFYLQNFKGIKNLGYHFDDTDNEKNKKGLAGDILGFNKYLTLGLKLSHNACPLLSVWDIQPFVFLNAALAPNRNAKQGPEQESAGQRLTRRLADNLRLSAGFGLTMDLEHIAIECYYNAYVSRQKNELRSDFQINFGID